MFFSFFKKVLFGCASLAARERARKRAHATQQTPSQTAAREAQKPPPRLSPDSCFEKKNRERGKKDFLSCVFFFVRHWVWHARGWPTKGFSHAPFAFKDSVIKWFCNWYHLSHAAAFFNEIESQVIHRDTLWEPCSTKKSSGKKMFF